MKKDIKSTQNIKKKVTGLALAMAMLAGTAVPASAATATFTFTHSGNTYGLTTQATNFPGYVTAWAKVTNTNNGTYKFSSNRAYKATSATAKKSISKSSYVNRTGAAYSS